MERLIAAVKLDLDTVNDTHGWYLGDFGVVFIIPS